jgi:putative transposase
MQVRATAKIKISATTEIVATIKAYTKALQFCIDIAWQNKIRNNIKLHYLVYKDIRKTLPSQLAIACISQACGFVKKAKSKPVIKRASVGYNFPRSANIKGNVLAIRTIHKRESFNLNIPLVYQDYFTNWKVNESLLRIDAKGRCFFLFTFSKEVTASSDLQNQILGIDLGVNNLAVTSDCQFYNSSKVKQVKRKFKHLRSILQAKGTKSSKRLLRKISGKETRWMAWVNHNISKDIVSKFSGNKIVMENLKGIRKQRRGKRMNYWISNWSFFQLQSFIQYKAERKGIEVVRVKPNYTSQICSKCGTLGSRSSANFVCHCGFSLSADLNAARNLASPMLEKRQAAITKPYIPMNEVKGQLTTATDIRDKYPCL